MPSASIQKLIQIPIFRGLSEEEVGQIVKLAEERAVGRADKVFDEGDPGDGIYVLLEGVVSIQKSDRAGGQQELARLSDGSVLGEMSLIAGDAARSASAVASTDARLLKISSAKFQALLAEDDRAALKIIRNLAQVMARRLTLMGEKVVELSNQGKKKEELADFQRILTNWSF